MTSAQAPLPALSIRLPILSVLSVLSFSPLPRLAPFSARRHASICQVLLSLAAADVPPGSDGRTDSQTYEISYPAPSSGFPFSILVYFPASFPFVPLFLPLSLSLFFSFSFSPMCTPRLYWVKDVDSATNPLSILPSIDPPSSARNPRMRRRIRFCATASHERVLRSRYTHRDTRIFTFDSAPMSAIYNRRGGY